MSGVSSDVTSHMLPMTGTANNPGHSASHTINASPSANATGPSTVGASGNVTGLGLNADVLGDMLLLSPMLQSQLFGSHPHNNATNLLPSQMLSSPVMGSNPGPGAHSMNMSMGVAPVYTFAPSLPNYTNGVNISGKLTSGGSPALGNSALVAGAEDMPLTDADLAVLDSIPMSASLVQMDSGPGADIHSGGANLWNLPSHASGGASGIQPLHGSNQSQNQNLHTHNQNPSSYHMMLTGIGSPSTASSESPSVFNSSAYTNNESKNTSAIPSLPSQSFDLTASQMDTLISNVPDHGAGPVDQMNMDSRNAIPPWLPQNSGPANLNLAGPAYAFDSASYTATSNAASTPFQQNTRSSGADSATSATTFQASPQFSPAAGSRRQSSLTSLPIDQLNLLSIQTSKSPSPNEYSFAPTQGPVPQIPSANNNRNNSTNSIAETRSINTNPNTNTNPSSNTNTTANTTPNPNTYTDNTINPKKLFRSHRLISTSLSSPSLTTLFKDSIYSFQNHYPTGKRFSQGNNQGPNGHPNSIHNQNQPISFPAISNLPLVTTAVSHGVNGSSRSSSTSASSSTTAGTTDTALTEIIPPTSLNMNDECFNAISYWLNNSDNEENNMIHNPTGIIMNRNLTMSNGMGQNYVPSTAKQRRNSIQLSNPSNYINYNWYVLKRKRRKSSTNGNGIEERQQVKDLLLSQQQNLQGRMQHPDDNDESAVYISTGNIMPNASNSGLDQHSSMPNNHQRSHSLNNPNMHPYLIEEQDGEGLTMAIDSPQQHMSHDAEVDNSNRNSHVPLHSDMAPPRVPLSGTHGSSTALSSKGTRLSKPEPKENHKSMSGGLLEKQAIQLDITNSTTNTTTTVTVVPHGSGDNIIFGCPLCDKQFKRSEHLKRHHRSVHSNIRPFHCTFCEKKFSRLDNLAQHLKTHYKMGANGGNGSRRRKESV